MKLNICTFNIRYDTKSDGINSFDGRKELIERRFPGYGVDVIGFQEVLPHVRIWLEEKLTGYTVLGIGREKDLSGEGTLVAYRTERFVPVSLDTFWLSDTPRRPGSRFATDQSGCPRICTCVVLLERASGKLIRFYNTHLDHVGKLAQAQGMTQILTRIAADDAVYPNVPVVLTGDFNVEPDSPVCAQAAAFASCGKKLVDVTKDVGGTFHAYHPEKRLSKIDYIYTNAAADLNQSCCLTDVEDGVYFSDHYPVMAQIEI